MATNSLFQRLHDDLSQVIAVAQPGQRLPSEPDLARQLKVSRATLREVMRTFETQGLIRRRQGVGTFVVRPLRVIDSGLEVLESIDTLARREGLQVAQGKLTITKRSTSQDEQQVLGLASDSHVVHISRVILAEGRPVAFLVDILPEEILSVQEFAEEFTGSVLDFLLQRSRPSLANSRCEISAVPASPEVARALDIQRGDALLCFNSKLYSVEGWVIDYSFSYFLPGYFRFHVVRELG